MNKMGRRELILPGKITYFTGKFSGKISSQISRFGKISYFTWTASAQNKSQNKFKKLIKSSKPQHKMTQKSSYLCSKSLSNHQSHNTN